MTLSQRHLDVIDASTTAAPDLTHESLNVLREALAEVDEKVTTNDAA